MSEMLIAPRAAVKTAWRVLVDKAGGVEAVAAACGIMKSLVSQYGDRNCDRYPPAQTIIAAERAAGEPLVTAALARAQGFELVLVDIPREHAELARVIADMAENTGALFATAAMALTHKRLTEREHNELEREFGNIYRVVGEAITLLRKEPADG